MIPTFSVQQKVVQLQITINDFVLVQILQTENDARGIENGARLAKHVRVYMHHQVATGRVLHHKAHMLLEE